MHGKNNKPRMVSRLDAYWKAGKRRNKGETRRGIPPSRKGQLIYISHAK